MLIVLNFLDELIFIECRCTSNIFNDELFCFLFQNNGAAQRQMWKIIFNFFSNGCGCFADQSSKLPFIIIFRSGISHKIQNC